MTKRTIHLLCADDEEIIHSSLERMVYEVNNNETPYHLFIDSFFYNTDELKDYLHDVSHSADVLLLDIDFKGGESGIDALEEIRKLAPELNIILLSAYDNISQVIQSSKKYDVSFLKKPIGPNELVIHIDKVLEQQAKITKLESDIIYYQSLIDQINSEAEKFQRHIPKIDDEQYGKHTTSYTNEQLVIVDAMMSFTDDRIIAVNAVAGSGKTHTADAIIRAFKPQKGFYTAFNKAIVQDSAKRFGKLIEAKTVHALAYKYLRPKLHGNLVGELQYHVISENISYSDKETVSALLDNFFRSSSLDINEFVDSYIALERSAYSFNVSKVEREFDEKWSKLKNIVITYAQKMSGGLIPPTFNYMLKLFHEMLVHNEVEISFDLFILDECQDTTAVTLEIFKLINAKKKVILGDTYQNIYSFMNTVNAFERLPRLHILKLTKSFRCNGHVASIVEEFGRKYLEDSFTFLGHTVEAAPNYRIGYITRTNAKLILHMHRLVKEGKSFTLTRSIDEIFGLPIALLNASRGEKVNAKYRYLEIEYMKYLKVKSNYHDFFAYIRHIIDDMSLNTAIEILMYFNSHNVDIFHFKKLVSSLKPNRDIILTTAHTFKGLEIDNVFIDDDLNESVNKAIDKVKAKTPTQYMLSSAKSELNTYYVALSRAKIDILNARYKK